MGIEDVNAESLTKALGGRWSGSAGAARCPSHDDHDPSLSVRDGDGGRLLTFCHAGCSPEAVWGALRDRGLVAQAEDRPRERHHRRRPQRPDKPTPEPSPNQDHALEIRRAAQPAPGTPVEAYLRHRGIAIPIPPTLRYHPGVRYERSGLALPCMVAAVQGPDRKVTAIHRTYLRDDGRGKAGVATPKMALGPIGAGAVRLGPAGPALGLAEGIETGLSAMVLFGLPVWAALSASRLDRLWLPPEAQEVHVFADNGTAGHEAAERAAGAYQVHGRRVFLRFPPEDYGDWNKILQGRKTEAA